MALINVTSSVTALRPAPPIVDRCVAGDERAWRELHRTYFPMAARFLRRLGVPPADADDVCQEVFAQVFRYLPRFEHRADFRTWLFKLCISQANRRRRFQMPAVFRRLLQQRAQQMYALPEWSAEETARRARLAVAKMRPAHRTVFVLFELEGLSGAEIADVVGAPLATVWRRLSYARREFQQFVNDGPLRLPTEDET